MRGLQKGLFRTRVTALTGGKSSVGLQVSTSVGEQSSNVKSGSERRRGRRRSHSDFWVKYTSANISGKDVRFTSVSDISSLSLHHSSSVGCSLAVVLDYVQGFFFIVAKTWTASNTTWPAVAFLSQEIRPFILKCRGEYQPFHTVIYGFLYFSFNYANPLWCCDSVCINFTAIKLHGFPGSELYLEPVNSISLKLGLKK